MALEETLISVSLEGGQATLWSAGHAEADRATEGSPGAEHARTKVKCYRKETYLRVSAWLGDKKAQS